LSVVAGLDDDYSSSPFVGQSDRRDSNSRRDNNNNYNNRRNANNREYNVRRQDYSNNNRGHYDDRDMTSCEVQPQQHSVSGRLL